MESEREKKGERNECRYAMNGECFLRKGRSMKGSTEEGEGKCKLLIGRSRGERMSEG